MIVERSVAGVCVREGKAFVAKRGPSGSCAGLWEFPGGKAESGESDQDALRREFQEEFGVEASPLRLLGETLFSHNGIDRALAAWLIDLEIKEGLQLREHVDAAWAGPDELVRLDLVDSDRRLLAFVLPLLRGAATRS